MEELSQRVAAAQASADAAAAASKATDALKAGEGGGGEDELDSFMVSIGATKDADEVARLKLQVT